MMQLTYHIQRGPVQQVTFEMTDFEGIASVVVLGVALEE